MQSASKQVVQKKQLIFNGNNHPFLLSSHFC